MAGISDDVENLRVNRNDFMSAFDEVQPAFGVAEEELQQVIQNGIIHFAPHVDVRMRYPVKPVYGLMGFNRSYLRLENSLLSKFERRREHRSLASSYMDRPVPEKPHWQLLSLQLLDTPSSNFYHRTRWSDFQSLRRSLPSTRCSRIVTRVR